MLNTACDARQPCAQPWPTVCRDHKASRAKPLRVSQLRSWSPCHSAVCCSLLWCFTDTALYANPTNGTGQGWGSIGGSESSSKPRTENFADKARLLGKSHLPCQDVPGHPGRASPGRGEREALIMIKSCGMGVPGFACAIHTCVVLKLAILTFICTRETC